MSLRLRLALFFTATVSLLLAIFCTVVFSLVRTQLLEKAGSLLLGHMEHEWSHLIHHSGHPDSGHSTLPDPEISIRVLKNGKLISGVSPQVDHRSGTAIQKSWKRRLDGEEFEIVGVMQPLKTLQYLSTLRNVLLVGCLLSLLFISPISWAFTGTLLRPFRELSLKTAELDAKHLSFRFPVPTMQDEYGLLVSSFNSLLTRLQTSFSQIHRFATNASHELRTPITVIRGEAELALRKERDVKDYEKALENVLSQSKKLQSVVTRLLALADVERMEQRHAERSVISIKRTVQETVMVLSRAHPLSRKAVRIEGEETEYVGQPEIFGSVLSNLVENAIKFSRETVRVQFHKDRSGIHLRVEDDGAGVSDADKAEIFEPFFRVPSSPQAEGHGLGLAIVKACVDAVRGKISLGDSSMGGLCVDVFLPEAVY